MSKLDLSMQEIKEVIEMISAAAPDPNYVLEESKNLSPREGLNKFLDQLIPK